MKSLDRLRLCGCAIVTATSLLANPVSGQAPETATSSQQGAFERFGGVADRFNVRGGPFFASHDTRARVDSETLGIGTLVNLEDDLGLQSSTRTGRIDGYVRLGRRHQIRGGFISLRRGANVRLQRQVQWGSEVFNVDVGVESAVDLKLIPANYRFSVVKSDRVDIGLSAGVFALVADARVAAPEAGISEGESATFPLPVFGGDFDVAVAPRVFLIGGVEYFGLSIQDVSGSWSEFRGGVEVFPLRNVGLGAAYRHVNIEIDGTDALTGAPGDTQLFFDYRFSGPQAYLTLAL
jgi:hypothetical protein